MFLNLSKTVPAQMYFIYCFAENYVFKIMQLCSFGDIRASSRQEMKFPSIKLQVANERFLPFFVNFLLPLLYILSFSLQK